MKQFKFMIKPRKRYFAGYRWAAVLLCLALCMEHSSVYALAAERQQPDSAVESNLPVSFDSTSENSEGGVQGGSASGKESSIGEGSGSDPESGIEDDSVPDTSSEEENSDSSASGPEGEDSDNLASGPEGEDSDSPATDPEGENSDSPAPDSEGEDSDSSASGSEGEDSDNSAPGPEAEDSDGSASDPEGGTSGDSGTEDDTDTDSVSGNDMDSVSDNDIDSVSDNDIDSISENDLDALDAKRQAAIQEAEEAFNGLLAEKDLMALLYHADSYNARRSPEEESETAAVLTIGQTLYIRGIRITEDDVWYEVQFFLNGAEGTGFVQSFYLAYSDEEWISWEERYLAPVLQFENNEGKTAYKRSAYGMRTLQTYTKAVDTSDISAFPGDYQSALSELKSAHPDWTFVPMRTGLDFDTSVSKEMGDRSLIQNTTSNASKGWVGAACPTESGWYYATKPAVAHYMDPRNFLTETYIFQFEQLTFNASYHTESAVQNFLNGTFMKGKLPDDGQGRTYARAFFEIGKGRKLSPIHLASRVYQEQGQGTSGLISGTYPGYEGYYNFFNVGVNGSSTAEKIVKGLTYAKNQGWNTRYKSLEGGAATIGNNYILKYQDTIYLEKFNVDKNSPYGVYNHQYMQNIQAPASESSSTKKMYANAGSLNSGFVFKIPVYDNMPGSQEYPVLSLNKTSMTLDRNSESDCKEGQQLKLFADGIEVTKAQVSGTGSSPSADTAVWKSSDEKVARVEIKTDTSGTDGKPAVMVRAVDAGEAVITASYKEMTVSCKVTVKVSLREITLNRTEIALRRPDTVVEDTTGLNAAEKAENTATAYLQASFDPADTTADKTIVWTSSNSRVAKVTADPSAPDDSSRALVSATGKGEAVITAKASKAGSPIRTASCRISVSAPIYDLQLTNPGLPVQPGEEPAGKTVLLQGQSVNLAAEYWPKDTTSDTRITWSSSNEKAATVKDGMVKATGSGVAVITARASGCEKGYTAQHIIEVGRCSVTFMKRDGKTVCKTQEVLYGAAVPETDFPEEKEIGAVEGSLFIGWYTGENGTGSRFDETTVIHRQSTVLYPYFEEQGKGFYVLPVGDQIYTGSAIKPVVQVYDSVSYGDGSRELLELEAGRDYTVSYKNNKKVNEEGKAVPTITVKGKGNYKGTETVQFNIVPKALTDTDIKAEPVTVAYTGRTVKSAPVIYRGEKKLVRNTDYTVTWPQTGTGAYQTAGTYPIVVTGKGGYTGTITVYETITNEVLMSKVTIGKIPALTYRNELVDQAAGKGIEPENLTVTYKGETLTESKDGGLTGDYTVSFRNNMAVGTATVTVTAVEGSGFVGSKSASYKIAGTSIARARVEGLEDKVFTGNEEDAKQTPGSYRLTLNDVVLRESGSAGDVPGDYVVEYSGISKAGTATIIFRGINEYTGQLRKTYKITGCQINSEEGGIGAGFRMEYYTQDAPDRLREITDLSQITTPYVKGGSKPGVVLSYNGMKLISGKDYTVKYANNNGITPAAAEGQELDEKKLPRITVTGKGSFKGSFSGIFKITDGAMSQTNAGESEGDSESGAGKGKVSMTAKDVVYKNKKNAWKSTVTLTDCNGAKLSAGKDYDRNLAFTYEKDAYVFVEDKAGAASVKDIGTESAGTDGGNSGEGNDNGVILKKAGSPVQPEDIPQAGTVIRVTAFGKGCYAGTGDTAASVSAVYRITTADISKARVTVQAQEYLNGHEIKLTEADIKVTMSGSSEPLIYGRDYVIDESTYANNRNKGKGSVVIRGIDQDGTGNYGGEKKVTFTIGAKLLVWWKNLFW